MKTQSRSTEGAVLKGRALQKLEQAQMLIRSASDDLMNLEGEGYCKQWEQVKKLPEVLEERRALIRRLSPPAGVFKW